MRTFLYIKAFLLLITLSICKISAGITYDSPGSIINVSGTVTIGSYDIILIKSGTVVKLTGTISLGENARVIIEKGAMLFIDGGVLTNTTNDESEFWSGIEIVGSDNKIANNVNFEPTTTWVSLNYSSLNFGILVSENDAHIKYSHYGVISSTAFVTGPTRGNSGGYFKINQTHFYNNLFSSIYLNTAKGSNGIGYVVEDCEFVTDFATNKPFDESQVFVKDGAGSISIINCTFKALRASVNKVVAIDANMNTYIYSCYFENFKSSIQLTNLNASSNSSLKFSTIDNTTIYHPYNTPFPCVSISNSDNVRFFDNIIKCELNTNGKLNPIINVRGSDNVNIYQISISYKNGYNSSSISHAINLRNTTPFKGLLARSNIYDMDYVIISDGQNSGFQFTCNQLYNTKTNDVWIYSGNIAPMQGSKTYPAENFFNPTPSIPTSRFNLKSQSGSNLIYWYNNSISNTRPLTYTSPTVVPKQSSSSMNPYYNCCAICLVKPNGDTYTDDLGFSELELSISEVNKIKRNLEIRNAVYNISKFVDSGFIDSALNVVSEDTSFFGVYYYSRLLMSIDSFNLAKTFVQNSPINNNIEVLNYKTLFPILCDRIESGLDTSWFENNKDSLYAILSRGDGFISEQVKSIIEEYSDLKSYIGGTVSYNIDCIIYPNPFTDNITIEIDNISSSVDTLSVVILDMNGNEIMSDFVPMLGVYPQNVSFSTLSISSGMYVVVLKHEEYVLKYQYIYK